MRRPRRPAHELRIAIDCLPVRTRQAMLDGVRENRIIVGAYVDRDGGVCPMLAAHRYGGRTSLASFARAWDRYAKAKGRPRPASERELRTLTTMLEASIALDESGGVDELAVAAAEHRAHVERADTGDRDRSGELSRREGWAWTRLFRRYDAYEAALEELEERDRHAPGRDESRERELV